jgi:hypothetical protein
MPSPQAITFDGLDARFEQLVKKYSAALAALGFPAAEVERQSCHLGTRLAKRDYCTRDSNRAIVHLHTAKRVTRFYLRLAIQQCPAQKARVARAQASYNQRRAEALITNPATPWFSFEASHARLLNPSVRPFAHLFRLGPVA